MRVIRYVWMAALLLAPGMTALAAEMEGAKAVEEMEALSATVETNVTQVTELKSYLKAVLDAYQTEVGKLQQDDQELEAALQSTSSESEQRTLWIQHLQQRTNTITRLEEDFADVEVRLKEKFDAINAVIGSTKGKQLYAEESANSDKAVTDSKKRIVEIQRNLRELQVEPEQGSDEYLVWSENQEILQDEFNEAISELELAVQISHRFSQMSAALKLTVEQSVAWQKYTHQIKRMLKNNRTRMAGQKQMAGMDIAFLQAGKALGDDAEGIAEVATMIDGLVKTLTESQQMDIQKFGLTGSLPPLPGGTSGNIDMKTFDVEKFVETIRSGLDEKTKSPAAAQGQ